MPKIGNTPEQLFHAWRTFKFNKNTDSVDSYVLRMSQVAAMLNYGEMQILENFKNTLPYRLYSTLINVNNLRDAIDLAKRVLTKEKLDRQMTGKIIEIDQEAGGTVIGQVIGVVITHIITDEVI